MGIWLQVRKKSLSSSLNVLELKLEDAEGQSNTLSEVFVSKLPKDMVVRIKSNGSQIVEIVWL